MNSLERFVLSDGIAKSAWGTPTMGQVGQGALWGADVATDFMPVIGGVKNLGKAVYHGAKGQWGNMLGDVGMAGLGMLGLGGVGRAAKGVGMAAKWMPKFKGLAEAAPTIAKGVGGLAEGAGALGRGIMAPSRLANQKFLSTGVGRAVASGRGQLTSGLGGFGATHMGGKLNEASELARQGDQQNVSNVQDMLQNIHQQPVFNNPVYSGGGVNPNYADVNPDRIGAPEERPSIASQLLGPAMRYFTGS
jgi:hypothetical protein